MDKCLSDSLIIKYLLNDLDTYTNTQVQDHLNQCPGCQKKIEIHAEDSELKQFQQTHNRLQNDESSQDHLLSDDRINQILDSTISSVHQASSQATGSNPPFVKSGSFISGKKTESASYRIIGHYQLVKKIGQGGMGIVFLATHTRLKKQVVLKILLNNDWEHSNQTQRFYREMELVGRLDHPNIVKATDAGEADDLCYLAMEYLVGHDLKTILKSEGPLPLTAACTLVRQIANGLQYIHNNDLIHRDIKPSNLFLTTDGQVKILDLGLAGLRYSHSSNSDLTQSDCIMGSVNYMAPEQAQSIKYVDHRSDIYSLGCTFYQLLTNQLLFKRETPLETIIAHREDPVPLLSKQMPEIPEPLEKLFQSMVTKRPEDRIQSMSEIVQIIDHFLEQQSNLPANDESKTTLSETRELRQICQNVELTQPVEPLMHETSTQYLPTRHLFSSGYFLITISAAVLIFSGFLGYLLISGSNPVQKPESVTEKKEPRLETIAFKTQATTEREVALWALKHDCKIIVQLANGAKSPPVTQQNLLPDEDFFITQIEFKKPLDLTLEFFTPLRKLSRLQTLLLADCYIKDDALDAIKNMTTLHKLDLHDSGITDQGLSHIGGLINLSHISLQKNKNLTNDGLQVLNQLQKLNSVNLARLNISDEGLIFLQNNPKLEWLNISETQVTDQSVKYLKMLNKLENLYLSDSKITKQGIDEIRKSFESRDPIKFD